MQKKLLLPELSYKITGLCFKVHSKLGRFCREKQYADELENIFRENDISHKREIEINKQGNRFDFLIENKIVLEVKAKNYITKEDYFQTQRYLQMNNLELGLIVNFRNSYLKPKRVLNTKLYSDYSDGHSDYSNR